MKTAIILTVLGVAIGFAAGFFAGRGGNGAESTENRGEERLIGRAPAAPASADAAAGAESAAPVIEGAPAEDADFKDKNEFVKGLAAGDPLKAIAWAQANGDEGERDDLFQTIAEEWAKRDPSAAFEWTLGLSLAGERRDAIRGVMNGALEAGHEELALSFIERLPPGEYQDSAIVATAQHFAKTDIDRAIQFAGGISETYSIRSAGRAIAGALAESGNLDAVRGRLSEMPFGSHRRELLIGITEHFANEDVSTVMAWIAENPTGPDGNALFDEHTMRSISYNLSRGLVRQTDPVEALAWAGNLGNERLQDYYLERIGESWSSRSPGEASAWMIDTINESGFEGMNDVSEGIIEEWIEVDQNGPFEQIQQIANEESRTVVAFMALNELARENPRLAAERMADWAAADPGRAVTLSGQIVSSWLRRDPEAASIWLNDQPRGMIKDRGVQQLVSSLLREDRDTESARAWVGEVQDEAMRGRLIKEIEGVEGRAKTQGDAPAFRPDPFR